MHNTKHKTNSNFNTPLFNYAKTQKRFLHQVIPIGNSLPSSLKNALPSLHSPQKLKASLIATQSFQF